MDSGFAISQVLGDPLVHTSRYTHFWQFYRQTEGCAANTNTPDLIDASGAVLETSKEKGSALLQRFVQHSNQNHLDERKAVRKGLDRKLTEAGSNDDLITELGFTEALSGLSNNTAPGPEKVKYSDIKNLSRASSSDCTKKASQQDRFPRIGHIVTSSQSQNRERTIAS